MSFIYSDLVVFILALLFCAVHRISMAPKEYSSVMNSTTTSSTIPPLRHSLNPPRNSSLELAHKLHHLSSLLTMQPNVQYLLNQTEHNRLIKLVNNVIQITTKALNFTTLQDHNTTTTTETKLDHIVPNQVNSTIVKTQVIRRSFKSTANVSTRPPLPSPKMVKLKEAIPIDLNRPCETHQQINIDLFENLYEDFQLNYSEFVDDKPLDQHLHDTEGDAWLNNHLNHNEEENQFKMSASKLAGKSKLGYDILQEMIFKANRLQGIVTNMIRKNLMQECYHLEFSNIWEIPKESYMNSNLVDSLSNVYQTLTNQTAHLYYIWVQQSKQFRRRDGCSKHSFPILRSGQMSQSSMLNQLRLWSLNQKDHIKKVSKNFFLVSNNLRGLMCNFKQLFRLFELPVQSEQIVDQVMEHLIPKEFSCTRISAFDCLIMRNAVRIFSDVEEYLRSQSGLFFH